MSAPGLLCLFVVGLITVFDAAAQQTANIAAFNGKTFGLAKMSDETVASIITDMVLHYDIFLLQEVRDASGASLEDLHDRVNRSVYGMEASIRLGRTSYKEQYVFFYRYESVSLTGTHQYGDSSDVFEREPFAVKFSIYDADWEFAAIALHAKPSDAVSEISHLANVTLDVLQTWTDIQDVMILGDLNADCSYVKESDIVNMIIYDQEVFFWPIGFDDDTTSYTSTTCAYDRFILSGPNLNASYVPGSADVFKFACYYDLSDQTLKDVSDHNPIVLQLQV